MTNKRVLLFCIVSICLLCQPGLVQVQSEAIASDAPLSETYSSMLSYGNGENYLMILEALSSLGAVTYEIKSRFGVDIASEINAAVKSKHKEKVLLALYKLIYWDISNTFYTIQGAQERTPEEVRTMLKTAISSYSVLSPAVERINPKADQRLRQLFEWGLHIVPSETSRAFTHIKGDEIDAKVMSKLKKLIELIQEECLKVFPDFAASVNLP